MMQQLDYIMNNSFYRYDPFMKSSITQSFYINISDHDTVHGYGYSYGHGNGNEYGTGDGNRDGSADGEGCGYDYGSGSGYGKKYGKGHGSGSEFY